MKEEKGPGAPPLLNTVTFLWLAGHSDTQVLLKNCEPRSDLNNGGRPSPSKTPSTSATRGFELSRCLPWLAMAAAVARDDRLLHMMMEQGRQLA